MIPPALSLMREFGGRTLIREGREPTFPDGMPAGEDTSVPNQVARHSRLGAPPEPFVPMACLNTWIRYDRPTSELDEGAPADFCCLNNKMRGTAEFRWGRRLDRGACE